MASPDFHRAFEDVLHRRRPLWHVVGGDRERLIEACIDWLTPERVRSLEASTPCSRAAWILDRLLPLDEIDLFRRLNSYERWLYTLYPLFRRAPEDMDTITPDRFARGERLAAAAAWVETRATDDELLGWHAECLRRGWGRGETLAVVEYCRRSPDANRLLVYVGSAPSHEVPVILDYLVRLVAPSMPRTAAPERGLVARLKAAGFDALSAAVAGWTTRPDPPVSEGESRFESIVAGRQKWSSLDGSLSRALWREQRGIEDIDQLIRDPLSAHRLGRIVPHDRTDIWDRAFASHPFAIDYLIHVFCAWCTREQRHLLMPHFDPATSHARRERLPERLREKKELEWAACAFHTYLALAPPDEVARLAEDRGRPPWQHESLDRWMHAPKELRPPRPRAQGPHEIVFDLREYDPFDVRLVERA